MKTAKKESSHEVTVEFILVGGDDDKDLTEEELETLNNATRGIQIGARIVDTPCKDMHTDIFIQVSKKYKIRSYRI